MTTSKTTPKRTSAASSSQRDEDIERAIEYLWGLEQEMGNCDEDAVVNGVAAVFSDVGRNEIKSLFDKKIKKKFIMNVEFTTTVDVPQIGYSHALEDVLSDILTDDLGDHSLAVNSVEFQEV